MLNLKILVPFYPKKFRKKLIPYPYRHDINLTLYATENVKFLLEYLSNIM
jgi:hypothetical protein